MDKINLLNLIGTVSVFVSCLLAYFLLTVKSEKKLANRLFAGFLIVTAIDLSGFFIYRYIGDLPNLEVFRISISALNMPLFYLYIRSACYSDFRLKLKHLLLAIPFLLINFVMIFRFYFAGFSERNIFLQNFDQMPEIVAFNVLGEILYVIYIAAIFISLKKYREIYLENYANSNNLTFKWLFQIAVISVIAHSFVIAKNLLKFSEFADVFIWANVFVGMIALAVLCWFVLSALYQPELFRGVDSNLLLVSEIISEPERITDEPQDPQTTEQIAKLRDFIATSEIFLEPELTIQQLADKIELPVRDLSVLINHKMDLHFFDFINEYRIEKAMKILTDTEKKGLTILEILYEVGFNSKSSFNTAFKKHTNLTPSEYRKKSVASM
jgi:AraC-like DNA-binding protein